MPGQPLPTRLEGALASAPSRLPALAGRIGHPRRPHRPCPLPIGRPIGRPIGPATVPIGLTYEWTASRSRPLSIGRRGAARAPRSRPRRQAASSGRPAASSPRTRGSRPALLPGRPAPGAPPTRRSRSRVEPAAASSPPTSRSPLDSHAAGVPSGVCARGRARRYIGIGRGGGGRAQPCPPAMPAGHARRPGTMGPRLVGRQQPRSCSERRVPARGWGGLPTLHLSPSAPLRAAQWPTSHHSPALRACTPYV